MMRRIRSYFARAKNNVADNEAKGAQVSLIEELFHDLYADRKRIYKLNFFRGIFFGVGSAIGGTLVLALVVWVLSLFVNFPVIGQLFEDAQNRIEQRVDQTESQR